MKTFRNLGSPTTTSFCVNPKASHWKGGHKVTGACIVQNPPVGLLITFDNFAVNGPLIEAACRASNMKEMT